MCATIDATGAVRSFPHFRLPSPGLLAGTAALLRFFGCPRRSQSAAAARGGFSSPDVPLDMVRK